ncbi:MAG: hypothetical protein AVDCRST_MAG35-1279, partial [uncultured Quadrisphaera sp.]
ARRCGARPRAGRRAAGRRGGRDHRAARHDRARAPGRTPTTRAPLPAPHPQHV